MPTALYWRLANRAQALPGKITKQYKGTHLDILRYTKFCLPWPIWVLEFGVPWGQVGEVMLVLRTFPELVGRSVQNLLEIGLAVWVWKGDIGTKVQTVSFIYIEDWR